MRRLVILAMLVLFATALRAQTTITGTVRDGLLNRPISGATVQLVLANDVAGRMRTGVTDSAGAFQIVNVAPGKYLLDFVHHRVDELGIELPPRAIEVPAGATTLRFELAIPGPRALARVLCNGEHADSSGAIAGRVLDAASGMPFTNASVSVSWVELRVSAAHVDRTPRKFTAMADDAGRFALCGIPFDIPVRVMATTRTGLATGDLDLQVQPFSLLHHDLLVAPTAVSGRMRGGARVAGHVQRTNGNALERAQVLLIGTGQSTLTDASGNFALDSLPAGTREIEARAIGLIPANTIVDLRDGTTATASLSLSARVVTLDAVTVFGKAPNRSEAGQFAERSRGVFGRFFTADQIKRIAPISVPELLRIVPGLKVSTAPGSLMSTITSRGDGFDSACLPDVFIDGFNIADGAISLDNLVKPSDIGALEVYVDPNTVPIQFKRGACGSIVIWTRIMVP
jgi:hypothetical protein